MVAHAGDCGSRAKYANAGMLSLFCMIGCRRLPGCPDAASKLLQAAMQPPDLPVSYSSADMSPAHQVNGDSDADEVSDTMLSPTPEGQQVHMICS